MNTQVMGRKASFARRWAFVLSLAALPALSGCVVLGIGAGAAAAAGAVVFIKGNLTQVVSAPEMKVHDAAVAALKQMQLLTLEDRTDVMTAKMESQFADGTRIWINLESINPESTKIWIRVGFWGEEQRARDILIQIQKQL